MKSKKPAMQGKNKTWQQKIEKQINTEKVLLDRPDGKEKFDQVIRKALKKKT